MQVFEGTEDLDLERTWVRFLEEPYELPLSPRTAGARVQRRRAAARRPAAADCGARARRERRAGQSGGTRLSARVHPDRHLRPSTV
ncbi:MAG: hypothetical protein MZW92_01445 [Comamonadaceae bacterium]|nr:hypothetical protein [Comamonadaceae bacterium]